MKRKVINRVITKQSQVDNAYQWLLQHCQDHDTQIKTQVRYGATTFQDIVDCPEMAFRVYHYIRHRWKSKKLRITIFEEIMPLATCGQTRASP